MTRTNAYNLAMINGLHALIHAHDASKVRAFFRDALGFRSVDAGHGWLIFAMPPAELAVHPTEGDDHRDTNSTSCVTISKPLWQTSKQRASTAERLPRSAGDQSRQSTSPEPAKSGSTSQSTQRRWSYRYRLPPLI